MKIDVLLVFSMSLFLGGKLFCAGRVYGEPQSPLLYVGDFESVNLLNEAFHKILYLRENKTFYRDVLICSGNTVFVSSGKELTPVAIYSHCAQMGCTSMELVEDKLTRLQNYHSCIAQYRYFIKSDACKFSPEDQPRECARSEQYLVYAQELILKTRFIINLVRQFEVFKSFSPVNSGGSLTGSSPLSNDDKSPLPDEV